MKVVNVANALTMMRAVLVIPIVVMLSFPSSAMCWGAMVLFVLACVTDYFDGVVARRSGTVSTFGKFLDPLADKLLICSVMVMLVAMGRAPAWVVIVILGREMAVTGLRAIAMDEGIVIAADRYGKVKTITQMLALGILIVDEPLFGWIPLHEIGTVGLYAAFVMAMYSGCNYFLRYAAGRRKGGDVHSEERQ